MAIADGSDGILDSGVFLEAGGIGCITPTLTLNAVNSTVLGANVAVEGCVNNGNFIFTLPQPLPDTTTFHFTIGGTALSGVDYIPFPDSIVMPAGDTIYNLPITIFADNILEGSETIELYYVDSSLCNNTIYRDTAQLEIWDQPDIPLLQDTAFCSADVVTIGFDTIPGQNYSWAPAFGLSDPTISNPDLSLVHQGNTSLTHTYYLITTALQGFCIWTDSMTAEVYPAHFADFTVDSVCLGNETSFTSSTVFDVLTGWAWDFGDGQISSDAAPMHIYPFDGGYTATLVATNSVGCLDTISHPVLVDSLPVLGYSVDPVCHTTPSVFVNDNRPGTTYFWDFGDGNTSTDFSPAHIYDAPGNYLTQVIGTTARGCQDSLSQTITVYTNPEAGFSFENQCFGVAIPFVNQSQAGTGKTLSYTWDFGDGTGSSTATNPVYQYADFGTRQVTLSVVDEHGCTDDTTQSVRTYALPVAVMQTDTTCAEEQFFLVDQSTIADNSRITDYEWALPDGRTFSIQNPSPLINEDGRFEVFLKVTTEFGCEDSTTGTILSRPLPVSKFSFEPGCALDTLPFEQQAFVPRPTQNDSIQTWRWDWDDGTSNGALINPGHAYATGGVYRPT
ncbi:MAG: PKD domain-containing protein, partial [Bacteroidota bacterium]